MNTEATIKNLIANKVRINEYPDIKSKALICKAIIRKMNYSDAINENFPDVASMFEYSQVELLDIINMCIDYYINTGKAYICSSNIVTQSKEINDILKTVYELCSSTDEN